MSRKVLSKNYRCFLEQPLAENIKSTQHLRVKRKNLSLDRIGIFKKKHEKRGVNVISTAVNRSSTASQEEHKEIRDANLPTSTHVSKGTSAFVGGQAPRIAGLSAGTEARSCASRPPFNQPSRWPQFVDLLTHEPISAWPLNECRDRFAASYLKKLNRGDLRAQPSASGQISSRFDNRTRTSKKSRIEKAEDQIVQQFLKEPLDMPSPPNQSLEEAIRVYLENNQASKDLPPRASKKTNMNEKANRHARFNREGKRGLLCPALSYNILMSIEQIRNVLVSKRIQSYTFSEYKNQLREIKKMRFLYGEISKRELKKALLKAKQLYGISGENLIVLLESRLDVTLHRCGFFSTIKASRQSVRHGRIQINSKTTPFPGYVLKPGDFMKIVSCESNFFFKNKPLKNSFVLPKSVPENRNLNTHSRLAFTPSHLQDFFSEWRFAVFPPILKSLIQVQNLALRTALRAKSVAANLFQLANTHSQTNFANKAREGMNHTRTADSNRFRKSGKAAPTPRVDLPATHSNLHRFLGNTHSDHTCANQLSLSTKVKISQVETFVQNCGLIVTPFNSCGKKPLQKVKQTSHSKAASDTSGLDNLAAVSISEQAQITLESKHGKQKWMVGLGSLCEPLNATRKRWKKAHCTNLFANADAFAEDPEGLNRKTNKEATSQTTGLRGRTATYQFFNKRMQPDVWSKSNVSRLELLPPTSHLQQVKRLAKLRKKSPFMPLKEETSALAYTKKDKKMLTCIANRAYKETPFKASLARTTRIVQALNFKPQTNPFVGLSFWKNCDFCDMVPQFFKDSRRYTPYVFSPITQADTALKYKTYCFFLLIKKKLFCSLNRADCSLDSSSYTSVADSSNGEAIESSFVGNLQVPTKENGSSTDESNSLFLQRSVSRQAKKFVGFANKTSKNCNALACFSVKKTKPLHLEISYKNLCAIFLYPPQRVFLPAMVDTSLLIKAID